MSERPILFSGPMVRAILDGRKTQTRRTIAGVSQDHRDPHQFLPDASDPHHEVMFSPPAICNDAKAVIVPVRFHVGDLLWVRETWGMSYVDRVHDRPHVVGGHWGSPARPGRACAVVFKADGPMPVDVNETANWRPSIHMPRWASRLTLEITDVRAERLQSISEDDAKAEGARCWICNGPVDGTGENDCACFHAKAAARDSFQALWDRINGKRAPWADNPYVWAITFRRVES